MKYDFDSVIERRGMGSFKWDFTEKYFPYKDILPMWVADMDFRSPQPVIEALRKKVDHGIFGYGGVPASYCESVAGWMKRRHKWDIQDDWIVQTPGVVPAIHMAVTAFSDPGDQVIVQTPVYYPFFYAIKCSNREMVENPLILGNDGYRMDFADLEKKITAKTKMVVLCSPHNPISRVWERHCLQRLGELCLEHNILVVSDEIHEDLVYSGYRHIPFASISDRIAANSIVCTAASKTFNLPGLHTSNIVISNQDLRKRFRESVRGSGFGSPNIFGIAATEAAYKYGDEWLDQLIPYLEGSISFLRNYISARIPGLKVAQPQGTYLLWLDFRECGIDPAKLANFVREDAKVALEPGFLFGCKENGFERMNIACPRSLLTEGLSRIERAVSEARRPS
jgi:cysteine-S-conjugate beta-lyase